MKSKYNVGDIIIHKLTNEKMVFIRNIVVNGGKGKEDWIECRDTKYTLHSFNPKEVKAVKENGKVKVIV